MTTCKRLTLLLTVFGLSCLITLQAQETNTYIWPVKLQKDFTKTFPVGNETIILRNKFGQMKIDVWDRNEVTVDVHISVSAQSTEAANNVLGQISINHEINNAGIEFSTRLGDKNEHWTDDSRSHEMKINYTVHLPARARLRAENSFGTMTIGDFAGEAELLVRYGTLTAGKLSNAKTVTVESGKAVIESISDSRLLFRYSKVDIGKLTGTIHGEFQFCNSVDMPVDNTLKLIDLKNNHTSLYLVLPKDFSADYDIVTTNARLSSSSVNMVKVDQGAGSGRYAVNSSHHYSGTLGKTGVAQISINSNSGNVRVM